MIDILIVDIPDILSGLLVEFKPLFRRRPFRQFCMYIASEIASATRSSAHLKGIFVEHTNQSNLNGFLRNISVEKIFNLSFSDLIPPSNDAILQRNGKHIDGATIIKHN